MAPADASSNETTARIRSAWNSFVDELRAVGEAAIDSGPNDIERLDGLRFVDGELDIGDDGTFALTIGGATQSSNWLDTAGDGAGAAFVIIREYCHDRANGTHATFEIEQLSPGPSHRPELDVDTFTAALGISQAERDDGVIRIRVGPDDPGGGNWLDTKDRTETILLARYLLPEGELPPIVARVIEI